LEAVHVYKLIEERNNMSLHSLKIGDLIVRAKGPFSTHYLVYLGIQNGIRMVAENQIGVGVRVTTLEAALANNAIKRFEPFGGAEHDRSLVLIKVNNLIGRAYDLVHFNCEHFARWIASGKPESKQVKVAGALTLAGGAIMAIASKNKNLAVFGLILMLIAGLCLLVQSHIEKTREQT
jgi:hypothetical protein